MRMLACCLLLLVAGCSGLLARPDPPQVYTPSVRLDTPANATVVTWQLQVDRPVASLALDSARIAVLPTPGELQFYRGVAWSDPVPDLLQTLIVHAFEDSGRILGVARQGSGLASEYVLRVELRALQAEYREPGGPPLAVVDFGAQLVDAGSLQVLTARRFRAEHAAASTAVSDVVRALEQGLGEQIAQLRDWTLRAGEANAQGAGPAPAGR